MTDIPDERTTPVRRGATDDAGDVDEVTAISRRGQVDGGTATEPSDPGETAAPGPRRTGGATAAPDLDPDEGSTIVARRESRRRASRAVEAEGLVPYGDDVTVVVASAGGRRLPSTLAGDVPAPLGRVARTPASGDAGYLPRAPEPVVVARAAPPARAPQPPVDAVAAEQAARGRARRRAAVVVTLSLVAALLAATAILILVTL